MRRLVAVLASWVAASLLMSSSAAGQVKPAARKVAPQDRCLLQLVQADRRGNQTTPTAGVTNFFAGGNVHGRCVGKNIHIYSDSVASYGGSVVQFLSQTNRVKYRDSTTTLDADIVTYFRDNERIEAQGNVVHKDLKTSSSITGPRVDYLRPLKGIRPEMEILAYNRPTVRYVVRDSVGKLTAPYVIVGNQVKIAGSTLVFAGGNVTIDRDDLHGTADSIWMDSGRLERGQMLRTASLKSVKGDGFTLDGTEIDLGLAKKELSSLKARLKAKLISKDVVLDADSILIALVLRQVETIRAWGKDIRPVAVSSDYRILGDSLVIEMPGQQLKSVRAYGNGWAGLVADSASSGSNKRRDWIAGDRVVASFVERDSAGVKKTTIKQLQAEQQARSYYQVAPDKGQVRGSVNYTRADRIVVFMRVTADTTDVDRVESFGSVDGVHLQPAVRKDSTKVDSTRRASARPDTTPAAPRQSP